MTSLHDSGREPSPGVAKAIALKYSTASQRAPIVVAKGSGVHAEEIIRIAQRHGVPIQNNPALVGLLAGIRLEKEIPPALYDIVAKVIGVFYKVEEGLLKRKEAQGPQP